MKKKSCRNANAVPIVDSIFDDFLNSMEFDFFSSVEEMQKFIGVEECEVTDSLSVDELPDNLEAYLNREDTLTSLLREKYKAQMQKIDLSEVEKKFFSFVPDASDTLRDVVMSVSRKMTRPLLRSMEHDSDEYAGLLRSLAFTDELTISFIWDVPKDIASLLKRRFRKVFSADEGESILGIRIEEKGYNPLTVYGMKNHPHTGIDKNSRFRYGFLCCDLADFLSMLAVHQQVNQYIYQLMHETTDNALYSAFHSRVFKFVCDSTSSHYQKVYPDSMALRYNEDYAAKWALPKYVKPYIYRSPHFNRLVTEGLITLLPSVPYQKIDSIMGENEACCVLSESGVSVLPYMFIMSCPVPYNEMVYRDSDGLNWGMPASIGSSKKYYSEPSYCELYKDLFMLIAEEKNGVRTVLDYYKELDGGYAKSFMLKKNIPQKVLTSMKTSSFNRYFGFVEYDEDTDLSKVGEISNEFSALWETYLSSIDSTEHVIRFRKLGQHKAAGLYYPSYGCLCVDVRHPSSLVHEYGHLIDFSHGCLSTMSAFYELRSLYKEALLLFMAKDEGQELNKKMKGKSKYNLSYYLTPTEIFARCFELYVAKILGVRNSIVPDTFAEGIYPQSDDFLNKVKEYFDKLLTQQTENGATNISLKKTAVNI